MNLHVREKNGVAIVDIKGKLILDEANASLRNAIDSLLAHDKKNILLNLSELEYIDSSGVGELVSSLKTVENLGGQLKLVNVNDRAYNTISIARLLPAFDISKDENDALAKFN